MGDSSQASVHFENGAPILRVEDMQASLRFYVDLLGFKNACWGSADFTSVNRDQAGIYLCRGGKAPGVHGSGSGWKT
jgi:catechol 2,3-dioxygenase-like lactoylglutathione lyase family enzyme